MSKMSDAEAEFDRWVTWPEWAKDAVVVDTDVHLSFGDAVRLLWKRRLTVTSKTFTAVQIDRTESLSRVYIEPWRRPPLDMVEARAQAPADDQAL